MSEKVKLSIVKVKGDPGPPGSKGPNGPALPFGVCSSAAGTVAKSVTIPDFQLSEGASAILKFTTANTAFNPTLNVAGTGAKPVFSRDAPILPGTLEANRLYHFLFDGTNWNLMDTCGEAAHKKALVIKTPIADLQSLLNGLPRILLQNVTIDVEPGILNSTLSVGRFTGTGALTIRAVNEYGAVISDVGETHQINNLTIQYNNLPYIQITGFHITGEGNSVYCFRNVGAIWFYYLKINGGTVTTSNYGIYAYSHSGSIIILECEISNKYFAIYAMYGSQIMSYNNSGSGNNMVYRARHSSSIRIFNTGAIIGTAMFSPTEGSTICDVDGQIIPAQIPRGANSRTTMASMPITKSLVNVGASAATAWSFMSLPEEEREFRILLRNTHATNSFTQAIPAAGDWDSNNPTSVTVPAGGSALLLCLYINQKYYVKIL